MVEMSPEETDGRSVEVEELKSEIICGSREELVRLKEVIVSDTRGELRFRGVENHKKTIKNHQTLKGNLM
jgi:hypothetical protein